MPILLYAFVILTCRFPSALLSPFPSQNCRVRPSLEPERWPLMQQQEQQKMVSLHDSRTALTGQ